MQVQLNGEPTTIAAGTTIEGLLRSLQINPHQVGIAVAINRRVIPRKEWTQTVISEGDQIELVYARQGG
ncbi:MAG: sulfur carrier protein ThiS [Bacteroidia bacterium]|nr:sulfur carrier protein ThiS [Bacteroidia bacterium]MDW8015863.1 sulfur carrier protein ThiS [Bacteroidia bacterium]